MPPPPCEPPTSGDDLPPWYDSLVVADIEGRHTTPEGHVIVEIRNVEVLDGGPAEYLRFLPFEDVPVWPEGRYVLMLSESTRWGGHSVQRGRQGAFAVDPDDSRMVHRLCGSNIDGMSGPEFGPALPRTRLLRLLERIALPS